MCVNITTAEVILVTINVYLYFISFIDIKTRYVFNQETNPIMHIQHTSFMTCQSHQETEHNKRLHGKCLFSQMGQYYTLVSQSYDFPKLLTIHPFRYRPFRFASNYYDK